jgi:hypothetical protein
VLARQIDPGRCGTQPAMQEELLAHAERVEELAPPKALEGLTADLERRSKGIARQLERLLGMSAAGKDSPCRGRR